MSFRPYGGAQRPPPGGERFECQPSGLSGEAGNEMSESTETSGNPSGAAAPIEVADSCREATEGPAGHCTARPGDEHLPTQALSATSSFSALRKKQRGPEGASNMVPQRGRPLWTPPAPSHRGTGDSVHPTGASQGRAATPWVLSLLARGLAATPELPVHRQTKYTSQQCIAGKHVHVWMS